MKLRIKNSVILILVLSLFLSGCGEILTEISNSTAISDADKVTVSFSWWGNDKRHEYTMNGVDLFEDANKNITVKNRYGVWQGY